MLLRIKKVDSQHGASGPERNQTSVVYGHVLFLLRLLK